MYRIAIRIMSDALGQCPIRRRVEVVVSVHHVKDKRGALLSKPKKNKNTSKHNAQIPNMRPVSLQPKTILEKNTENAEKAPRKDVRCAWRRNIKQFKERIKVSKGIHRPNQNQTLL
jgi:hypothetical protein